MTRRRDTSRRSPESTPLSGRDLVACVDGPLAGQWYHRADWTARRQAAQRMGYDDAHPAAPALGYVEDRGPAAVEHPSDLGGVGHAARWALGVDTTRAAARRRSL